MLVTHGCASIGFEHGALRPFLFMDQLLFLHYFQILKETGNTGPYVGGTRAQAGQAVTNHLLEAGSTARLLRDRPSAPVLGVPGFMLARISRVTEEFQQFFQADTIL